MSISFERYSLSNSRQKTREFRDHRPSRRQGPELDYPFGDPPDFGHVKELAAGLYWLRMPLPFALDHINLYLLEDGEGWVILDTGLNTSMVRDHWQRVFEGMFDGKSVTKIIVTHYHPDHIGLAGWLSRETGAPIFTTRTEFLTARTLSVYGQPAPPGDVIDFYRRAGFSDEALAGLKKMGWDNYAKGVSRLPQGFIRLCDNDEITIGDRIWRVDIGTGHAPEHACLYCDTDQLLISGDQVLPRISSNVSVYPSEPLANPLRDWLQSLRKFRKLPKATLVMPAHNEPFRGLHERLDHMFEGHMEKLGILADHCREPKSAVNCLEALFSGSLSGLDFFLGIGESLAHLHCLEVAGTLERQEGEAVKFIRQSAFDRSAFERGLES